jgi:hypothetical protein
MRQRPAGTGRSQNANADGRPASGSYRSERGVRLNKPAADPIEGLLSRLDRVRNCGRGWIARCPAHEDRTASLSVTAGDDGRVLLHCFAGCAAADVVAAVGLSVADLFLRRPTENMSRAERAALREHARQAQWRAALNVLAIEATIVAIAATAVGRSEALTGADIERIHVAAQRIHDAQAVLA